MTLRRDLPAQLVLDISADDIVERGFDRKAERINLTMPGVCCTVAEQIAALKRVAGDKVAARIRRAPDALVERIVAGWPRRFDARRSVALGFKVEATFDDIIRAHIEDEVGGKIVA